VKKNKKVLILALGILFVVVCFFIFFINRINMEFAATAETRFVYGGVNEKNQLDAKELEIIKSIFDGKTMTMDSPSCGFTENVSIVFNDSDTFCIACDTCPIVYWIEEGRYIKLTEEEKEQLYSILEKYGFRFPCI